MSLERRQRLVEIAARARAARARGQPVRDAALRGRRRCRRCYALDGGVYVMYLGTFSKILSPGIRLGWVVAPPPVLEKINLGKQARRPVHLHAVAADGAGLLRGGALARLRRVAHRDLPRPARHDARRAGRVLPRARPSGRGPPGGLFIWATLPDFIDTTDLLARALRDNVAFVPGEAAYLDGRGRNAMRLNFSASDEDDDPRGHPPDRQGRDASRSRSTARSPARAPRRRPRAPAAERRRRRAIEDARASCRVRRAQGAVSRSPSSRAAARWSARCRCARAARVEDALERLGHEVRPDRRRRRPDRPAARRRARRRRSSRCTAATARTAPCRSCSRSSASRTRARACSPACAAMDKVLTKHLLVEAGLPDAGVLRLQRDRRSASSARPTRCPRSRSGSTFPIVVKPARAGLGARHQVRAHRRATCRPRSWPRSPTTRKRAARAPRRRAATWRSRSREAGRREALPIVEAVPREEDFYDFEARYEIGRTDFVCPADLPDERRPRAPRRSRSAPTELLGLLRLRARRPDARGVERRAVRARGERDPGLTETSLLPQAAEAAGIELRRAGRADPGAGAGAGGSWRLAVFAGEVLGRDLVEEVLELLDDLLLSSTSCSNSIADSAITSSAAKIGALVRTASASASEGRESISTSRPFTWSVIDA